MNPNANGRDLYYGTTRRFEYCITTLARSVPNVNHFISVTKHKYIPSVLLMNVFKQTRPSDSFICLNKLIRKTHGIYNTNFEEVVSK